MTENGYCLDPATKRLNPGHELIRADLAIPERPRSAIGVIVEALRRRRDAGLPPFTVLSCDNSQANGAVLREAVLAHARMRGATATSPAGSPARSASRARWSIASRRSRARPTPSGSRPNTAL